MKYECILIEQRGGVTLITLNRPQALNALNSAILKELTAAFAAAMDFLSFSVGAVADRAKAPEIGALQNLTRRPRTSLSRSVVE